MKTVNDILINLEENLKERAKLLNETEKDDDLKKYVYALCKKDPVYFFKMFVWTDRNASLIPERFGNSVPFILFEYQEEFVKDSWEAIMMGQSDISLRNLPTDLFSEKSRQMGFSWTFAGLQLYAFIFHNLKSLYISKKADEVDKKGDIKSHFEKIRYMINKLPKWLLPKGLDKNTGTDCNKYMNISRKDGTGSIIGESANPNAGRGGTFAFVIFDEMAFMQYAEAINMSISSATPCRFFNSTPNGEGNEYYRMRELAVGGLVRYHRCHWSEHPLYTQEWYNWKTKGMTKEQIAQELEIDYNVALKGRVYPNYTVGKELIEYDESLSLYMFIDNSHGGADPHALILAQKDGDNINIIDTCEFNCSPRQMAKIVARQPDIIMSNKQLDFYEKYKKMKVPLYISDPYDTNSTIGDNTIFGYYQEVGIFLNIPNNRDKKQQIQITKSNIHRVKTSKTCTDFMSAIQNSIYPEIKEGSTRTRPAELPVHNWTSHLRSALEYGIVWITENEKSYNKKPEKVLVEVKDHITGEIKYIYQ